jgi:hypothetical protein
MPFIEIPVRRSRTFVPGEAHGIAARFRTLAGELRGIGQNLQSLGAAFNATWEGTSKQRFMTDFDPARAETLQSPLPWITPRWESILLESHP